MFDKCQEISYLDICYSEQSSQNLACGHPYESQVLYMGNKVSSEKGQAAAGTEQVISESSLAETLGHLKTTLVTEKHSSKT